jgi:hypothetical protein
VLRETRATYGNTTRGDIQTWGKARIMHNGKNYFLKRLPLFMKPKQHYFEKHGAIHVITDATRWSDSQIKAHLLSLVKEDWAREYSDMSIHLDQHGQAEKLTVRSRSETMSYGQYLKQNQA